MKSPIVMSLLLAAPAAAFVTPPSSTSTMMGTPLQQRAPMVMPAYSPSSSALQMNLLDRFMRVTQANVNKVLQSLEAPEKIMNQAVIDMQSDLVKVRKSYAEIVANQRRQMNQRDGETARAQDWYNRAQLALRNGNEGLAKEALARRQQHLIAAEGIQAQLDVQAKAADQLYTAMQALETKIQEAAKRKSEFVARAKAAESTQKVNDMLTGITGVTSMDAFKRMEEKVEALEAAAEASAEMAGLPTSEDVEVESEFLLLESSEAVQKEFDKLKGKMLPGSPEKRGKIYTTSVEKEFAELKSKSEPNTVKIPVQWVE